MPRPTLIERAAKYVAAMPPGISGQDRHGATVAAANVLLHGFGLKDADAWALLNEFNARCQPPSDEAKLKHRFELAKVFINEGKAKHWLAEGNEEYGRRDEKPGATAKPRVPMAKPVYDLARLRDFAGEWANTVDLLWLANRSVIDPALLDAKGYLAALYAPTEHVVVFDNEYSQGCAVWPEDGPKLPDRGRNGCWYLAQPVDGLYHPNPRSLGKDGNARPSRRSEESVTAFRYLVIESDEAPLKLWLGALAKLPLRIAAIYTSGGRSVHALVRVDAKTKEQWDAIKAECFGPRAPAGRFLISNGADKGVLSAVRLTRLPGCYRLGKMKEDADGREVYVRFPQPQLQKLLYINPDPPVSPLVDLFAKRDVEKHWAMMARAGISDASEDDGRWLFDGLAYYATRSATLSQALEELRTRYP